MLQNKASALLQTLNSTFELNQKHVTDTQETCCTDPRTEQVFKLKLKYSSTRKCDFHAPDVSNIHSFIFSNPGLGHGGSADSPGNTRCEMGIHPAWDATHSHTH